MQNITERNFHIDDVIAAYVDGMADELYQLYLRFPDSLRKGKVKISASGNGLRKNKLLCRAVETKFQIPLSFSNTREEAAVGSAMLAAHYEEKIH